MTIPQGDFRLRLLSAFIGNMALAIFSLFLPLLAYEIGASALEIGLVGGTAFFVYSFIAFAIGRYLDKTKARKKFMVLSFLLLAASSLFYAFASTPLELIAFRVLEGAAWACFWPILNTSMREDVQREASKSFSIYNSVWSVGSSIGPLVGFALVTFLGVHYIFLITAIFFPATAAVNSIGLRGEQSNKAKPLDYSGPAADPRKMD